MQKLSCHYRDSVSFPAKDSFYNRKVLISWQQHALSHLGSSSASKLYCHNFVYAKPLVCQVHVYQLLLSPLLPPTGTSIPLLVPRQYESSRLEKDRPCRSKSHPGSDKRLSWWVSATKVGCGINGDYVGHDWSRFSFVFDAWHIAYDTLGILESENKQEGLQAARTPSYRHTREFKFLVRLKTLPKLQISVNF